MKSGLFLVGYWTECTVVCSPYPGTNTAHSLKNLPRVDQVWVVY